MITVLHLRRVLLCLICLGLVIAPSSGTPVSQASSALAPVSTYVWAEVRERGEADVLVIMDGQADLSGAALLPTKEAKGRHVFDRLRTVALESQAALVSHLRHRGIPYRSFYIVNMVRVVADTELLLQLAERPDVARLEANPRVRVELPSGLPDATGDQNAGTQSIPWGIERVHAPDVWGMGIRGQGTVVAGNDTGILWDHPALKASYRGWDGAGAVHDSNWHDAVNGLPEPYDDHGHGTITLGTVVGAGGDEKQIGMAPEARWIGCKNMDGSGEGTPARYIECFEFFLAPYAQGSDPTDGDPGLAPDVINNSWTCPPGEGCDPYALQVAVAAVRAAGIVDVFAAGNYGSGCNTVQYPPATYEDALTVGAFSSGGAIAGFSSRGPVTADGSGRLKPDVVAPGVQVLSSTRGGGYDTGNGTSMAAPHVAGQVALMLTANPALRGQVDAIEEIIVDSAAPVAAIEACGGEAPGVVPNNTWGHGIIDALEAVKAALHWGEATPTSTASATLTSSPTATRTATHSATPSATPSATGTPTMPPGWRVHIPRVQHISTD